MVEMQGAPVARGIFKNPDAYDRLLCIKCGHLLRGPVHSVCCGHRFCKSCADGILSEATTPQCPYCGEDITNEDGAPYFPDNFVRIEIRNLDVICPFCCKWEGKFQDYDHHVIACISTCPLSALGCSNTRMSKSELECHLSSHRREHLNMMVNRISSLQKQCDTIQAFYEALRKLEVSSKLNCGSSWRLEVLGQQKQPCEWLLRLLRKLELPEQKILVKLLQGLLLQPLEQVKLLSQLRFLRPLEQSKLLRLLDGLEPVEQVKLVNLLERLGPLEQHNLLSLLGGLVPVEQKEIVDELKRLEQWQRLKLLGLNGLKPVEWVKLLDLLERLEPLEQSSCKLLRLLDRLEPVKRMKLVDLLERLEPINLPGRVNPWNRVNQWDELRLLRLLDRLEPVKRMKLVDLLERLEPSRLINLVRLLVTLGQVECEKLVDLLERLEPLGIQEILRVLEELEVSLDMGVRVLRLLRPLERLNKIDPLKQSIEWEDLNQLEMELERLVEEKLKQNLAHALESYKRLLQLLLLWLVTYLSKDGDRRGGFRNLLLDGWWLEFWEIILLLAGDVERNPGPRRMTDKELENIDSTILVTGDLSDVFDAVYNCRAKWCNLCLILGISADDLSAIKKEQSDDSDDSLREGLTRWLRGDYDTKKYGRPTWRSLVDAVANSSGGDDHALALDIAEKHKAIPTVLPKTNSCVGLEGSERVSSAFNTMYRSVRQLLRVNVREVKDTLCCLIDPRCQDLNKLCVPREVYEDATSTNELLKRLCPTYINPNNTFILREIVAIHGSQRCKRLLQKYMDKFC